MWEAGVKVGTNPRRHIRFWLKLRASGLHPLEVDHLIVVAVGNKGASVGGARVNQPVSFMRA